MNRALCSTLLVAAAALAGCDQSQETTNAGPDDSQPNATANATVTLPPSIAASKTYRCKDNSLVYVDWLSDGSARLKSSRTDIGTPTTAEDLKGDAKSTSITANGKTCHL